MKTTDLFLPAPNQARIEIIPLIDVIFFLLATFVLFTLSLNKITALPQPLPVPGRPDGEDQTVYIQASEAGTYYWKQGRLSAPELIVESELTPRLHDYSRRVSTPRVFVRGDGKAKFGTAVHILDQVRRVGIAQVSIETTASPSGT